MVKETSKKGPSTADKILGTLVPMYGAIKGVGPFGGLGGIAGGALGAALRGKNSDEEEDPAMASAKPTKMAKGGSVKKPRDGLARRGKTKGRMC